MPTLETNQRKFTITTHYTFLEGGETRKIFLARGGNGSRVLELPRGIYPEMLEHNPFDHSSHYGTEAFEGMRAFWNTERRALHIVNFAEHLDRLIRSMEALYMIFPDSQNRQMSEREIPADVVERLKDYNPDTDIYFPRDQQLIENLIVENLLLNIEAGNIDPTSGEIYIRPLVRRSSHPENKLGVHSTTHHVTLEIMVQEWGSYLSKPALAVYPDGIDNPLRRHKCGANYGFGGVAKNWATVELARKYGKKFDDALILGRTDLVQEATGANFFAWDSDSDGTLITPPKTQYILPGTKRKIAINMARALGIPVAEEDFHVRMLVPENGRSHYIYTSAFLTGTATGFEPIHLIYDPRSGNYTFFEPNEALNMMVEQYKKMVRGEEVDSRLTGLQEAVVLKNRVDLSSVPRYR